MRRRHLRLAAPVEYLPPRPRALAPELRLAPELAAVAILDDALRSTLVALLAAHSALDDVDRAGVPCPPTLRRARQLVQCAFALRDALDDYRSAVFGDLGTQRPPDDDIPF